MREWKSSDGGTITPMGSSSVSAAYSANTVVVASGVNVRGVTIRTALLVGGAGSYGFLKAAGVRFMGFTIQHTTKQLAVELFVPAGGAIEIERTAGTLNLDMTYDIH